MRVISSIQCSNVATTMPCLMYCTFEYPHTFMKRGLRVSIVFGLSVEVALSLLRCAAPRCLEMFWILQRGFTELLVCELQWLVIFNGCSVAQHMDPVCRFLTPSVNRTDCTSDADGFMKPDQHFHSHLQLCMFQMTLVIVGLVHAADGICGWPMCSACTLLNTGAVCGQIFMRC